MICRVRTSVGRRSRAAGFTFLEIALTMAIIVVVFVALIPLADISLRERRLRTVMDDIAELVADQRTRASESGRPLAVTISEAGFEQLNEETKQFDLVLKTPPGIQVAVRFPNEKWEEAEGQRWDFAPAGMVTPLSIRVAEGDAYIEQDYDFLTGRVAEERFSF